MIERRIDRQIEEHYRTSSSSLLLTGARQTGKTFAIRKFAKASGLKLVEINFLENPEATRFLRGLRTRKKYCFGFLHIPILFLIPEIPSFSLMRFRNSEIS